MFGPLVVVCSLFLLISVTDSKSCINEGGFCSGRGLFRCCSGLLCEKDGPRSGKCVKCLGSGKRCFRDRSCCSKQCSWFKCE
ncbi:hypothetical protein AAHC03_04421 [Spirometra sp. Aus1]